MAVKKTANKVTTESEVVATETVVEKEVKPVVKDKTNRLSGEVLALVDRAIAERYDGDVKLFNKKLQNLLKGTFDL